MGREDPPPMLAKLDVQGLNLPGPAFVDQRAEPLHRSAHHVVITDEQPAILGIRLGHERICPVEVGRTDGLLDEDGARALFERGERKRHVAVGRRADQDQIVAALRRLVRGIESDSAVKLAVASGIDFIAGTLQRRRVDIDEIDRPAEMARRMGQMIADRAGAMHFDLHAGNRIGVAMPGARVFRPQAALVALVQAFSFRLPVLSRLYSCRQPLGATGVSFHAPPWIEIQRWSRSVRHRCHRL